MSFNRRWFNEWREKLPYDLEYALEKGIVLPEGACDDNEKICEEFERQQS